MRYLTLLAETLCNWHYLHLEPVLDHPNWEMCETLKERRKARRAGTDFPISAYSMVGLDRLLSLGRIASNVGEQWRYGACFVDIGIWRGGTTAMMAAAALKDFPDRPVYGIDTFEGFDEKYEHSGLNELLAVPRNIVYALLAQFGRPENVILLTPSKAPPDEIGPIALLRVDVDEYDLTLDYLMRFGPSVVDGGVIIVDDYDVIEGVTQAVSEYRGTMEGLDLDTYGCCSWRVKK